MFHREYYQYEDQRLQCCLSVFHGLLHIVRSVRDCGPPFAFWQYPMERFCGMCLPYIKSKKNPYSNLVNNISRKRKLGYLKYLPEISEILVFSTSTPKQNHILTIGNTTYQLHSALSNTPIPLSESDKRYLVLFHRFLIVRSENRIFTQNEGSVIDAELKKVNHNYIKAFICFIFNFCRKLLSMPYSLRKYQYLP